MSGKRGGKAAVRAAVVNATPAPPPAASPPQGHHAPADLLARFEMRPDGLFQKYRDNDGKERERWLCAHLEIEAETRNPAGGDWGLLLAWRDRLGVKREAVFARSMFTGECGELRSRLADGGFTMNGAPAARQGFAQWLNVCRAEVFARSAPQCGWSVLNGWRVYVHPHRTYGDCGERVLMQAGDGEANPFASKGTLGGWKHVAALMSGNSRLIFAASCAFAAPLLSMLGEEGGGFNLRGASRIGKTTALRVAASVCGGTAADGARGYVRGWRATSNGLETVAVLHNDALLLLDEISQGDGKDVGNTVYMLSNRDGKIRSTVGGRTRPAIRFKVLFLSTGEVSLAAKMAEAGHQPNEGQSIRLVDIPADAAAGLGLFEHLHGHADAGAFVQSLCQATAAEYGTALPAFLEYLTEGLRTDPMFIESLRDDVNSVARRLLDKHPGAGGQVRSVAGRFALVAAAGRRATMAGITGWNDDEAEGAAESCFSAWLTERGTEGAGEEHRAVVQLRAFIVKNGAARFERWVEARHDAAQAGPADDADPPAEGFRTQHRAGWRRWQAMQSGGFGWKYYLTPEAFAEAMQGLSPRESAKALVRLGYIVKSKHKSDIEKNVINAVQKVPGTPGLRLYEISETLLPADGELP